ncbi:MAG: helicase-related protein [Kiritimatiellae bacterium]|nr:helicase-related protein [Kiritimatiellia bacterium]
MSTKFFTNEGDNTLLNKFAGVFKHNPDIEFFDALVGYFYASGYFSIRPYLDDVPNIRILVGINVDELIAKFQTKGLLFKGDAQQTIDLFLRGIKQDIQTSAYERKVEHGILQFVEDIATQKIEIRAHPEKNLHAKIYIFRPEPFNEHKSGHVITGSSNLTEAGLGKTESANYEFNVLLSEYDDVQFATGEFEKLWKESVSILPVEIGKLKKETFLNTDFSPYEVYIKFLIEYFGSSIEFDPNSVSDLPKGFMKLSYQVDAVNQGFELLRRHNGFFLADVVGLGKTVIAALIAKKFFYTNGYPSHVSKTLIVLPPALKDNWQETLDKFGLHNFKIITNGSLHKIKNPRSYDLIIVDEAHKFRNDTAEAYDALQRLCKSPTLQQLPDGSFAQKKIILVSATPLNNRPEDIRNLVFLFQDGKDSTLEISNLQSFFNQCSDAYKKAMKKASLKEAQIITGEIYTLMREKVIKPLTVRRTRTDLLENDEYATDLTKQGIVFPTVLPPEKILYQMDAPLEKLYDRTMDVLRGVDNGLTYSRYRAIEFLVPDKKALYSNADLLSSQLAKIMRILLVKRIDSSFYAFKESLGRFLRATEAMVSMFENGRIYIAPNLRVTDYIVDEREDELIELINEKRYTDPTIQECTPADFEPELLDGLKHDQALLAELVMRWDRIDYDPKMNTFIEYINNTLFDPARNPTKKLVVFSESKDTTNHIYRSLKQYGLDKILCIDAGNRQAMRTAIKQNFDANILKSDYRNAYNIIITTEVLAEGVNLHRANSIVHYDTPWNSTRLMQRIGRLNRIGSQSAEIHNYIFYPTAKVDDDIALNKRAVMKLQAFHSALGEDSQIYSLDELVDNFGLFEKNLKEERDEHLVYLMALRKFKELHPEKFRYIKNMPLRARTGRRDKTKALTTLCFIRNRRRDAFYFVKQNGELDELTFVECARQFKAEPPEAGIPLHDQHHQQVTSAVQDFADKLSEEAIGTKGVDVHQGPNEKKALSFLSLFSKLPETSEQERFKIDAAMKAIKLARFQKLQRDINKLQKNLKKVKMNNAEVIDALMNIINRYPLEELDESSIKPVTIQQLREMKPEIIISESFHGRARTSRDEHRPTRTNTASQPSAGPSRSQQVRASPCQSLPSLPVPASPCKPLPVRDRPCQSVIVPAGP